MLGMTTLLSTILILAMLVENILALTSIALKEKNEKNEGKQK